MASTHGGECAYDRTMVRLTLVVLLLGGCGGKTTVGGTCSDDGDCKDGLFCATAGSVKNTCTASCEENTDYCFVRWGEHMACSDSGYCIDTSRADQDSCGGRCPPSTTKCVAGSCVPK